jgi:hypothetical protein
MQLGDSPADGLARMLLKELVRKAQGRTKR